MRFAAGVPHLPPRTGEIGKAKCVMRLLLSQQLLLVNVRLAHQEMLSNPADRDKCLRRKMTEHPEMNVDGAPRRVRTLHAADLSRISAMGLRDDLPATSLKDSD
jgi:hypothetical protein